MSLFGYSKHEIDGLFNFQEGRLKDLGRRIKELEKNNSIQCEMKLDVGAKAPTKSHETDAGFDLYCPQNFTKEDIQRATTDGHNFIIPTGVHIEIPEGYVGLVQSRSSMSLRGFTAITGVIDAGYQGEIKVNFSVKEIGFVKVLRSRKNVVVFNEGDRIAQLVILPIPKVLLLEVDKFSTESERGENGFGSTGE